jgi:hypothetical protein
LIIIDFIFYIYFLLFFIYLCLVNDTNKYRWKYIYSCYQKNKLFQKYEKIKWILKEIYVNIYQRLPLGKRSGVNFMAACIFPLIFIFPCMKAFCGLSLPSNKSKASWSIKAKVASAFPCLPSWIDPDPFLRSTVHDVGYLPFVGAI